MEKQSTQHAAPQSQRRKFRCGGSIFSAFAACLAAVFWCGCASTPVRSVPAAVDPERRVSDAEAGARLRAFRELLAGLPLRAVKLYPGAYFGRIDPEAVVARVVDLGFNLVIVSVSSERELDGRLREFLAAAGARGLPVYIELRQRDFFLRYRGNAVKRLFIARHLTLAEAFAEVVKFNATLPEPSRLAGAVVAIEPHLFTAANPDRPRDMLFAWSGENFGPGLDNELMVRHSLKQLEAIAASSPLKLAVEMPDFYQELVDSGRLGVGSTADFVAAVGGAPPFVIVDGSGNRPSEAAECLYREAETMPEGVSMLAGITLAGHTSNERGALRRRDWGDFMRALAFLRDRLRACPSFSGVVIGPLRLVEFLRLEQ